MKTDRTIKELWQATGALAGSFAAGALMIMVLGGFVGLPERHADDVAMLDERIVRIEDTVQDIHVLICILTNEHLDRPVEDCVT